MGGAVEYAVILGMALATYATRAPGIFLFSRPLSPVVERCLRHIPAAVFAALAAPPLLAPAGSFALGLEALAALPAAAVAWRTRQVFPTILTGLVAFWLLRALGL
jgi:branched-subunit amino acid transport protein